MSDNCLNLGRGTDIRPGAADLFSFRMLPSENLPIVTVK